jgi:hypothetical protein
MSKFVCASGTLLRPPCPVNRSGTRAGAGRRIRRILSFYSEQGSKLMGRHGGWLDFSHSSKTGSLNYKSRCWTPLSYVAIAILCKPFQHTLTLNDMILQRSQPEFFFSTCLSLSNNVEVSRWAYGSLSVSFRTWFEGEPIRRR